MDIPAPVALAEQPSLALLASPAMGADLEVCVAAGRMPILMHELAGEKERATVGPRELLEQTLAVLAAQKVAGPWGAGGRIRTPEEGAQFARAGYTWFTLELARKVDRRAESMSLDELDSAIVALEDAGVYAPFWYERYVDRDFSTAGGVMLQFADEVLARAAVKFAPAFLHAEEMDRAIRACWIGRGEMPDFEVSIAPGGPTTTKEELLFLGIEMRRRLCALTALAPALGNEFEPGREVPEDPVAISTTLSDLAAGAAPARLSLPSPLADLAPVGAALHLDATEAGRLTWLGQVARREPAFFREWLEAARLAFPIARAGWPITLNEEEARFLPQVEDGELESMFLGQAAGRQLLLATWEDVAGGALGVRLRALR
jgi:hypothetical protein